MTRTGKMDGILLTAVLLLCLIGVLFVYSSSAILAQVEVKSDTAYLRSQMGKLLVGCLLMLVLARLPYGVLYGRPAWWVLGLAVASLLVLLLPLGLTTTVRQTRRFLDLGVIQGQPVEYARLALVVFLSYYAAKKEEWMARDPRGLVVPLTVIATLAGATLLQPNLSSAVLLAGLGFALLYLAGQPVKRLLLVVLPLVPVVAFTMKAYQLKRILDFISGGGGDHPLPYQVRQSLIALGSGGLFGAGVGKGLQKYYYLPFPHTDFILGIVGEETGFLGVLALFTLYGIVIVRGLKIARSAPDRFSELLALGLTLSLAMNFILHSVVVLGLGPVTGVPLPFVSHGGSSLLVNLMAVGILLSISRSARSAPVTMPAHWGLQDAV